MKKYFMAALVCFLLLPVLTHICAAAADLGIATGNPDGTYYRFGLDLEQLMAQHGIWLSVYPSAGSVDNIYTVYKVPSIQLGMVQSDVLAFVAKDASNKTLKAMGDKIRVLFPLYDEEVHLVSRGEMRNFNDLSGKRVAVGQEGSGTYLTARLLFEASGIKPEKLLPIGDREALSQLKAGKIDAMFFVGGAPVKLFSQNITQSDRLRLVPVLDPKILAYYPAAEIPANTYAWQDEPVPTVAVKAVLVAYSAGGECKDECGFARVLFDNLDQLAQKGHPKWKSVDLRYHVKGWKQCDCAKKILGLSVLIEKPLRPNPVIDAIEKALN